MTTLFRYLAVASVAAATLQCSAAWAADSITTPPVPTNIQVPAGNTLYLKGQAQGTAELHLSAVSVRFFVDILLAAGHVICHDQVVWQRYSPADHHSFFESQPDGGRHAPSDLAEFHRYQRRLGPSHPWQLIERSEFRGGGRYSVATVDESRITARTYGRR